MKKFLKFLSITLISVFVLVLGLLYYVQNGIKSDFYACDGKYEFKNKEDGTNGNGNLYFALTQYPFFNIFWSTAYGNMSIETHWEGNESFYGLEETLTLELYEKKEDDSEVYFSLLSHKMELVTKTYTFKGSCSKRK